MLVSSGSVSKYCRYDKLLSESALEVPVKADHHVRKKDSQVKQGKHVKSFHSSSKSAYPIQMSIKCIISMAAIILITMHLCLPTSLIFSLSIALSHSLPPILSLSQSTSLELLLVLVAPVGNQYDIRPGHFNVVADVYVLNSQ